MANVTLKTMNFPGLFNNYVVPQNIAEEYSASKTYSIGDIVYYMGSGKYKIYRCNTPISTPEQFTSAHWSEIDLANEFKNKANVNGYYQEMTVGDAEQLLSDKYTTDQEPYTFRASGSNGADREYDEIVGGSVVWNQLISALPATTTNNGVTFTNNGDGSITASGTATDLAYANTGARGVYAGHKYLFVGCPNGGSASTYYMGMNAGSATITGGTQDTGNGTIFAATADGTPNYSVIVKSGTTVSNLKFIPQTIDLTAMFGTTIADYIYSLEQSSAGAGVAWFRKLFPEDYYAYNTGTMMHVSGVSAKKNVVKNLFLSVSDNVALGYRLADGSLVSSTANCSPNNPIYIKAGKEVTISLNEAIGNIGYVVTSISGEAIARVNTANASVAVVPAYSQDTYLYVWFNNSINFTIETAAEFVRTTEVQIEIGDERTDYVGEPYIYPLDSTLTLRGIPKLDANNQLYYDGDTYAPDGTVTRRYAEVDLGTLNWKYQSTLGVFYVDNVSLKASGHCICSKYVYVSPASGQPDKTITLGGGGYFTNDIAIKDSTYTDAASFKTAMSGVMLVYELATPTTEEAEPYNEIQIVDDFGTEEYITTSIVPVGHYTKYPANLRSAIERVMEQVPEAPSANGTYTLKATVTSNGVTYAWTAE